MQGITVALSLEGIKQLVEGMCASASYLETAINNTSLNDYSITDDSLGEAWKQVDGSNAEDCTQIHVYLSQGAISGFTISSSGPTIQQQANGTFVLSFSSGAAFNANYTWNENWSQQDEYYEDNPDGSGQWVAQGNPYGKQAGPFAFSLGVGGLDTTATFTFTYDSNSQTWQLPVSSVRTNPSNPTPNIPGGSVLQHSTSQGCNAQIHLEQGAVDSLDKGDDFHTALKNGVFNNPLASIPASGQLTRDITFAFGLGDSPVAFPNDQGLTVGVTGISTYTPPGQSRPQQYPGTPPTNLPIPAVPTDGHHLQIYVSDYVIDGLYWAFFMDNQLNVTVTPSNADNPNILKVRTWDTAIQELKPYASYDMQITITPVQAPTVEFQTVYLFTQDVMNSLQQDQALKSIWGKIPGMLQNVYPNQALLEQDLANTYGVASTYFGEIEKIAGTPGAAVSHDIQFNVTIPDAPPINGQPPFMEFTVNRIDVLENLGLGVTNSAQTVTFDFNPGTNSVAVTFNKSNFLTQDVISDFGTQIWPQACETPYDHALTAMGQTGVPLPSIKGFKFLFEQAQVSIQVNSQSHGFIGILSNVEFQGDS